MYETGEVKNVKSFLPKRRQELLKWNGWGYNDSKFILNDRKQKDMFGFIEGIKSEDLPKPVINEMFFQKIKEQRIDYSFEPQDRLFRSHGHTLKEIFDLRIGNLKRIPDIVIWPSCHDEVVTVVQAAVDYDVVIIPFGGGTNVSCAVVCPEDECRMIVSLDTSQMNKILWVNKFNNTALVEAGIIGQDLDRELAEYGLCTGHEPDSYEFSTLGGWVATRSSGMKKNIYGNIEDIVVHVKMVTPKGVIQRNCLAPRMSGGPDVHQIILGSEGTLGVITEVVIKLHTIPPFQKYGSIAFPTFELGVKFLQEVGQKNLKPASIRLIDNDQFIFAHALKAEGTPYISSLVEWITKFYLTKIKSFDLKKICAVTLLMEGDKYDVECLEKSIYSIAVNYGGLPSGEMNGKRGYMLTFVIAYIRDLAIDYGILSESFETSVPWDKVLDLCKNVKACIENEVLKHKAQVQAFVSYRVTQSYDVGACVYFYFAFSCLGVPDPMELFESIERVSRDEVLANGGCISHHHGVGKLRKRWMKQTVSDTGLEMLKAVKSSMDPLNIFASGNLFDATDLKSSS
ncbi:Alkyldihydroxyacetonephosphate synthase like protein [Argiope bruennichi]|uniref:Alkylglycerone-phosphate synthase n=1 Tax=Argiope bruennichi TaxID=94029 RepID=A0A8T0FT90_ARGBR|nr:Alkyldihydroxyacetonephosphate synthase like protein [Argiope bruennichi]